MQLAMKLLAEDLTCAMAKVTRGSASGSLHLACRAVNSLLLAHSFIRSSVSLIVRPDDFGRQPMVLAFCPPGLDLNAKPGFKLERYPPLDEPACSVLLLVWPRKRRALILSVKMLPMYKPNPPAIISTPSKLMA